MPKDSPDDVTSCNYRQMTVMQNPLCRLISLEECTRGHMGPITQSYSESVAFKPVNPSQSFVSVCVLTRFLVMCFSPIYDPRLIP